MAQERIKYVKLYSPYGTEVEVSEERGEVLKGRGYTAREPRNPTLGNNFKPVASSNDARVADLEAQLAKAQADLAAATKK